VGAVAVNAVAVDAAAVDGNALRLRIGDDWLSDWGIHHSW